MSIGKVLNVSRADNTVTVALPKSSVDEMANGSCVAVTLAGIVDADVAMSAHEAREQEVRDWQCQGVKADADKDQWSLVPWAEMRAVVRVLGFGARKYSPDNWQKVPGGKTRYFDAALRHLVARKEGEVFDAESGEPHLAHAVCCCLFSMWFDSHGGAK